MKRTTYHVVKVGNPLGGPRVLLVGENRHRVGLLIQVDEQGVGVNALLYTSEGVNDAGPDHYFLRESERPSMFFDDPNSCPHNAIWFGSADAVNPVGVRVIEVTEESDGGR